MTRQQQGPGLLPRPAVHHEEAVLSLCLGGLIYLWGALGPRLSHFPPCSPASASWQSSGSSGVYQLPTKSSYKFLPVRLARRAESHWEAWFEPRSWDPRGKQAASLFSPVKWLHPTAENRCVQPNGSLSHPSVGPGMGQPGVRGGPVPITLALSHSYSSRPSAFIPAGEAGVLVTERRGVRFRLRPRGQGVTGVPPATPSTWFLQLKWTGPRGHSIASPVSPCRGGRVAVCVPGPECLPPWAPARQTLCWTTGDA